MIKLTEKQLFVGGILLEILEETGKGATCYQVMDKINEKKKQGNEQAKKIDTKKINSTNATCASIATKELVVKTKVAYNEKMVTCYTLNEKGIETFKNTNEEKEEN